MGRISIDGGIAGASFTVTSSGTAACPFSASVLSDTNGRKIKGALVECDPTTGYDISYAFGGTSPAAGTYHKLAAGAAVAIEGYANCASMKIITYSGTNHGKLYITPYY